MKFRWNIAASKPLLSRALVADLKLPPLLAQCLVNRGLGSPERARPFLEPRLKSLADPFLLPQMDLAVNRLFQARERGENLVIFLRILSIIQN